jgi:hypothetical protein
MDERGLQEDQDLGLQDLGPEDGLETSFVHKAILVRALLSRSLF